MLMTCISLFLKKKIESTPFITHEENKYKISIGNSSSHIIESNFLRANLAIEWAKVLQLLETCWALKFWKIFLVSKMSRITQKIYVKLPFLLLISSITHFE